MAYAKSSSRKSTKQIHHNPQKLQENKPPSWSVFRSIITCKHFQTLPQQQQQPKQIQKQNQREQEVDILTEDNSKKSQKQKQKEPEAAAADTLAEEINHKKSKKMRCSGSICSNTKVMQRPEPSSSSPDEKNKKKRAAALSSSSSSSSFHDSSSRSLMKAPLNELTSCPSSNSFSAPPTVGNNSNGSSFRGMPFRRLSGCYECRMVVDPVLGFTRDPSLRSTICSCPDCGEIFMKAENLELHQAVRHAVSEMGPEDTSKNIVEIIFQSSWLKKQSPVCKIDRILKVHNTTKTVSNFEVYRDSIKSKANKLPKKHPRCIADGNELLRFHSTNFMCSLGLNGSSNLCNSTPNCEVCSIIKNGFKVTGKGILTTATSGKAHDSGTFMVADGGGGGGERRAMLVCRVIAGRVKKTLDGSMDEFDSVASGVGVYSNVDELYVFNPNAILPCFVVIYSGF